MKNKIIRSTAFLMGLAVLLLITSTMLRRGADVDNTYAVNRKIKDLKEEEKDSINVIFVGDSESYSAFNPYRIYKKEGFTSYVCGTSLQKLCDTYALLKKCFEMQSPKTVVLETNCLFRCASNYDDEDNKDDKATEFASRILPIIKYHNRWKSAITLERLHKFDDRATKGFKVRTNIKPYTGGEWMHQTDSREEVDKTTVAYFKKIKELVEDNGAQLVLVSVPSPDNWTYAKHNAISDLASEENVNYVDINLKWKQIGIDWNLDSKDGGDHLNFTGANKISDFVSEYLKELNELPDNRSNLKYDGWEKDIEKAEMEL